MNKNNALVALMVAGVGAAAFALFALGSGDEPAPPPPGPQLAQSADDEDGNEGEGPGAQSEDSTQDTRSTDESESGTAGGQTKASGGDDAQASETEQPRQQDAARDEDPQDARNEQDAQNDEQAAGLAGRLGGDVDESMIDPQRERRDERSWESRYAAVDEALVGQVPALSPRRERAMRRVLELFRESRQEILRDLREDLIDRQVMRKRARHAKQKRDARLKKVLTPAQYASLDFDEAHFQAAK